MNHSDYMKRAFELARMARGKTWPNPMVGAVLVKDGKIIGEGFHPKKGESHAEVFALDNATSSPEGATIYVTLEPCCHLNKSTPPCAQRLIKEKIKCVVISNLDPNPSVNGQGVELLRSHGIEVITGVMEEEGERLNEVFFLSQRQKRPFIHLKLATTLDGKIALPNGESQWITSEKSREDVHIMRSLHQGIIVGAETVRKDNPRLTVRLKDYQDEQPYRIVFTKSGNLPKDAHLFTDDLKHKTLIYTENPLSFDFPKEQVILIKDLKEAMNDLFKRNLISLMLEGGATLASEFIRQKIVDRISVYLNPSFLGEGFSALAPFGVGKLSERPRLTQLESRWIGDDHFITGRILCSQD